MGVISTGKAGLGALWRGTKAGARGIANSPIVTDGAFRNAGTFKRKVDQMADPQSFGPQPYSPERRSPESQANRIKQQAPRSLAQIDSELMQIKQLMIHGQLPPPEAQRMDDLYGRLMDERAQVMQMQQTVAPAPTTPNEVPMGGGQMPQLSRDMMDDINARANRGPSAPPPRLEQPQQQPPPMSDAEYQQDLYDSYLDSKSSGEVFTDAETRPMPLEDGTSLDGKGVSGTFPGEEGMDQHYTDEDYFNEAYWKKTGELEKQVAAIDQEVSRGFHDMRPDELERLAEQREKLVAEIESLATRQSRSE